MTQHERFTLLDTPVSAVTMEAAVDLLKRHINDRDQTHVCVCSVNMLMQARTDAQLRKALDTAGLIVPDGFPLTKLGQHRASAPVGRVRGTDLTLTLCEHAAREGHKVYLYGGAEGVPEQMADVLRSRYPELQVVGTHSPPFRPLTPDEDEDEVEAINASGADIVFVGIGCPKQERWMLAHRGRVKAPVLVGVGAAFDFIAGAKDEAPRPMQRAGLEWAWRFASEPRRLWRRVLVEGPHFLALVAREEITGSWRREITREGLQRSEGP